MTLVMTATPLSMHINDGYSVEATANVIRAHVLGMYLPSLVSGFLIEKLVVCSALLWIRKNELVHREAATMRATSIELGD